jgi:hypothetical protein
MVASRETLQDLAAERQLQPATLERVIRLIDILDAFGSDALIGPRIALKGGRIIAMPNLDWAKIKAATLMIGASARSFDWRTASPDAIECEVGDITGMLTMCLHDRYFDAFGGPSGWIGSVTAECREKLAPLFQLTACE